MPVLHHVALYLIYIRIWHLFELSHTNTYFPHLMPIYSRWYLRGIGRPFSELPFPNIEK